MSDDMDRIVEDRRPLYVQAAVALAAMIERQEMEPGDRLPKEKDLAEKLGVSRNTLREALRHLETQGVISRRHGVGTFVTRPSGASFRGGIERLEPLRDLASQTEAGSTEIVDRDVSVVPASPELAELLKIAEGTNLVRVQITEAVDSVICMYVDDYLHIPESQLPDISSFAGSVITYLLEYLDHPLSHTRSEIFAIDATDEIAEQLNISPGKSVLHLQEQYFSTSGTSLGVGQVYILTDFFHFYVTRRASDI